ncbi:MAG: hypothetical protein ACYYK0_02755 [Candidatus Eutrophobiaceae bacterium]
MQSRHYGGTDPAGLEMMVRPCVVIRPCRLPLDACRADLRLDGAADEVRNR